MSDIVLIYPYFRTHARDEMLFHPLGTAQLAAVLRRAGLSTRVIDCTFRQMEDVVAEVRDANPRIVGMYVMVSMSDNAMALVRGLRDIMPGTLLVCGGPLPTLQPARFAHEFDLVFRGEAVHSFPRFCQHYLTASLSPTDLSNVCRNAHAFPGIYAERNGMTFHSPPKSLDEPALRGLAMPDRSDYRHPDYQRFWTEKESVARASIMTSYGCPYDCDFCSKPIFGSSFRRRHIDRIVQEILDIKRWGYNGLWIGDDCFTLDMDHVRGFCERLVCDELAMNWTCLSRTNEIGADDVELMRKAGCQKLYFGLESGSDEVLSLMNKKATVAAAEETLRIFASAGIETAGFFMVGYPGETYETIERTFAWALSLPLDEISFTVPYPLPGTGLFDRVCGVQSDADWRYENENRFVYKSEFDEEYLKKRIDETCAQFAADRTTVARSGRTV